jgi:metal-responsive CopG/Arc/MetJ family transcriptional regulator
MPRTDGFGAVNLKEDLFKEVDAYLESEEGKKEGYKSRADFIDKAVRKALEEAKPRFTHINVFENLAIFHDNSIQDYIVILFREGGVT